jgi:PEGA domain-containing protein
MLRRNRVRASAAALCLLLLGGCVERKLVLRTDPPGAMVSLEDEPVPGRTPLEVPCEWDGVRRVTLTKEGHHVLETTADVSSRWYDWFPLDFLAQFLWPGTIHDDRVFEWKLEPYLDWRTLSAEEKRGQEQGDQERLGALKERAETYRRGGSAGPGGKAPSTTPEPGSADEDASPPPPLQPQEAPR